MIGEDGYRQNVGIIIANSKGRLFWAKRLRKRGWQFPQGGIVSGELPLLALYRELHEETGLRPWHVKVVATTQGWLRYQLPERYQNRDGLRCVGQKQKWFFLRLIAPESVINLFATNNPEFDRWEWVDYWYPLEEVVSFKRHVYRNALERFFPLLHEKTLHKPVGSSETKK